MAGEKAIRYLMWGAAGSLLIHLVVLGGWVFLGQAVPIPPLPGTPWTVELVLLSDALSDPQPEASSRVGDFVPELEKSASIERTEPSRNSVPEIVTEPFPADPLPIEGHWAEPLRSVAMDRIPDTFPRYPQPERMTSGMKERSVPSDGEISAGNQAESGWPEDYLKEVRARLDEAKQYPWMARLRGLEGTSLVRFRILAGGSVDRIGIIQPSTHRVLDEAAMETVQRAAPFPVFPDEARLERIELNVPVIFELDSEEE
jgi:periplasmic protein TonB